MVNTLWPADPDPVTQLPAYSGRRLRQVLGAMRAGASSARPLGARSGIRQGPTSSLVTATSATWTINPHAGTMDLQLANEAGAYDYALDAAQTGAMTPAPSNPNSRIDIVWVRLDDPAEGDGSAAALPVPGYTAGVAGASPSVPVPPPIGGRSQYVVLAQIAVPFSGAPVVTIVAPFSAANGGRILVRSQAERDALPLFNGLHVHRLDTGSVESYHGGWRVEYDAANWTGYTPTFSGEGGGSGTAGGSAVGRYKALGGKTIAADFTMVVGANVGALNGLTGIYNISLPVAAALALGGNIDVNVGTLTYYGGSLVIGNVLIRYSSGGLRAAFVFHGQTAMAQAGNPGGWASTTRIVGNVLYEAA
ncbi:MAG: hypothetical protein ABI047_03170 [Jatrophihabitantaceae bacterium]